MARLGLLLLLVAPLLNRHGALAFPTDNATAFTDDFDNVEFEPQSNLTRRACALGAQACYDTETCCEAGTFCVALDVERTRYACAADRILAQSIPPTPDNSGTCAEGWTKCANDSGCCGDDTTCTLTNVDDSTSPQVCLAPTWPDGVPAGQTSNPFADNNESCSDGAVLCGGRTGAGCCAKGLGCLPKDTMRTSFVCASSRVIPGAPNPTQNCPEDSTPCRDVGCCAAGTTCQPIDYNQSKFVCTRDSFT